MAAYPHEHGANLDVMGKNRDGINRLWLHDCPVLRTFTIDGGVAPAVRPEAPRYLGLALIGTGIVSLFIALSEYRWLVRYLWSQEFKPIAGVDEFPHHTPILGVLIVLIVIGIYALGAVLLRLP